MRIQDEYLTKVSAKTFGGRQVARMSWVPQRHWEFPCYSHTRDVIGPVFQPDCRLVAVTLPLSGINDKKTKAREILLKFSNMKLRSNKINKSLKKYNQFGYISIFTNQVCAFALVE
jgi:hypothetical protein